MASSSSSSSHSHTSWTAPAQALWVLQDPALDHNGVFKRTQGDFDARLEGLRSSGVSVVSQVFDLFAKVEEYIKQHYPDGIDLLGFRMHSDEHSLDLSHEPGGTYSLQDTETAAVAPVQNTFSQVRKFVMIEGCKTGSGKNGILKHVVSLCPAGVVGIGSKGSEFEVGFDPTLPGFMSFQCLQSNKDITRIYYKAENGSVQNIPADELMLLWDLFKEKCTTPEEKERGFELCYQLLGERNDPVAFARIRSENQGLIDLVIGDFKAIRKELLGVNVSKSGAKAIWAEMLHALEALKDELGGEDESTEILVDKKEREKTADQVETQEGLLVASCTPYQKVYLFVLGCAFIDKYKPLLMLLDNEAGYGPASQAIYALSALTVHGDDLLSITTMLGHYFPIIKKSYLAGKDSYLLKMWFKGISRGICFNNQIAFIDEFYQEWILPSKEERLQSAILKDNEIEVRRLIAKGVKICFSDREIDRLLAEAIDRKSYYISFLLHEQLYPDNDSEFMNNLALECEKQPLSSQVNERIFLISKYLAGKGKRERALAYAQLIQDSTCKYATLWECARLTALLHEIDYAVEIIETIACPKPYVHSHDQLILQMVEIALNAQEFAGALRLAQLIGQSAYRSDVKKRVFHVMLANKPLEEVITFLKSSYTDAFFLYGINQLLAKGKYDEVVQLADAMQNFLAFDQACEDIVKHLLTEKTPDVALELAVNSAPKKVRKLVLMKSIKYLMKSDQGSVELIPHYAQSIQEPGRDVFIAFLCLDPQNPDQEAAFISDLRATYWFSREDNKPFDKQVKLISRYLVKKGDIERALNYVQLIKDPLIQGNLVKKCADAVKVIDDGDKAEQLKCKCVRIINLKILELENRIKNRKHNLQVARLASEKAKDRLEKAERLYLCKVQKIGHSNIKVGEFRYLCVCSSYNKNLMSGLNRHTTPLFEKVTDAYESCQRWHRREKILQRAIDHFCFVYREVSKIQEQLLY